MQLVPEFDKPSRPDPSRLEDAKWVVSGDSLLRTVRFARLRCIPRRKLVKSFAKLESLDLEAVDALMYRFAELEPTSSELHSLARAIDKAARSTETASAERQAIVEKSILRAMRLLPSHLADRFARRYANHKRKGRRRWAYATLRRGRISGDIASEIASVYRKTHDKDLLGLITRTPQCVRQIGADYLLHRLKGEGNQHWRGRVIECLLAYDRSAAIRKATQMPWEFTYAVGRSEERSLLPVIRNLFKSHKRSFDFVSIYIWALGKIGAVEEINLLDRFVRRSTAFSARRLEQTKTV